MSKVLQERGFGNLPSSTEANSRDQVKSISTTIEADSYPIRRIGSSQYAVSTGQNRTMMPIVNNKRSLDPINEDYIKLNDLNEPFKLMRNQGDDLMPTIEEGEVIEEFKTRDDELDTGIDVYPIIADNVHIMNVPIFVGTFYVVMDFAVLEDMDNIVIEGRA
ncbi:hypothetical protein Tco_1253858 [Tanacetum coccineum]